MNKIIIIFMIAALNQVCIYSQPFSTQLEWEAYYDNSINKLDPIEGIWSNSNTIRIYDSNNNLIENKYNPQVGYYAIYKIGNEYKEYSIGNNIDNSEMEMTFINTASSGIYLMDNYYKKSNSTAKANAILTGIGLLEFSYEVPTEELKRRARDGGGGWKEGNSLTYEHQWIKVYPNQTDYEKTTPVSGTDKNDFVFQKEEIEKLTKAPLNAKSPAVKSDSGKRKGFIGITLGPSIPVGAFADKSDGLAQTGLQFNLINFGYLFSDNIGISATWFGAANPLDEEGYDPWSYGGIMAGLLLSFPLSDKVEWDFRPMIGYAVTTVPDIGFGPEDASSFALNIGTLFKFNVGKKVALLLSADYFSTQPEFINYGFEQNISTISLGFGVAFRLK